MKKSFTLIELLIVIGILAILVVTILITLNPSEAQKKARDAKRMKDLATLQAIVLQWTQDGNPPMCTTACWSNSAGQVKSQPCNSNWLGQNVCNYTNSVPVDPLNGQNGTIVCDPNHGNNGSCLMTTETGGTFTYVLRMQGSDYKIGGLQESKSNASNVYNDGGTSTDWVEIMSSQDAKNLW